MLVILVRLVTPDQEENKEHQDNVVLKVHQVKRSVRTEKFDDNYACQAAKLCCDNFLLTILHY